MPPHLRLHRTLCFHTVWAMTGRWRFFSKADVGLAQLPGSGRWIRGDQFLPLNGGYAARAVTDPGSLNACIHIDLPYRRTYIQPILASPLATFDPQHFK